MEKIPHPLDRILGPRSPLPNGLARRPRARHTRLLRVRTRPWPLRPPPLQDDTAITSRLDEIELTMRKYLIRIDAMDKLLHRLGEATTLLERPAPVAASDPQLVEAIAVLSKKVDGLLERPVIAPAPESQNLAALTKQVTAVSQQLTSLTARHSTAAAAPTTKPAPAATTKKPAPTAATTAKPAPAAAAETADPEWNPVVSRRTKRKQQTYPPVERRIIVQFPKDLEFIDTRTTADAGLRDVNRTLVAHPDVTVPPFYTAHITRTNALVLTAGLHSRGRDYEPFLGIICNALAPLTVSAHVSQQWTRYVVNGIPTDATLEDAREELEMLYPAAKLAKTPRWLTTAENRQSKAASSMNLTDSDIERVSSPEKMLNDEVINSYLSLLTMHSAADRAVHLPTQFWTSYASHGYDKVKKWLPKCWSPDHTPGILLIPINQNLHWFLISVDFARRQTSSPPIDLSLSVAEPRCFRHPSHPRQTRKKSCTMSRRYSTTSERTAKIIGTSLGLDMDRKTTPGNPTSTFEMVLQTPYTSTSPSKPEIAISRPRQLVCPPTSSTRRPTNLSVLPRLKTGPIPWILLLILSNVFNFF
jgi:hypothetical protein